MSVELELISLPEALEWAWLPWQRLAGQQSTLPTLEPAWWQACARCPGARIEGHYLAVAHQAGHWLGAARLRAAPASPGRACPRRWVLDLSLVSGGGLLGTQPTALFQCLLREWVRPSRAETVLAWVLDQADVAWQQRWQTAMACNQQKPSHQDQRQAGWLLERLDPGAPEGRSGSQGVPSEARASLAVRPSDPWCATISDLPPGMVATEASGGCEVLYIDPSIGGTVASEGGTVVDWRPLLEHADGHPAFRWVPLGPTHWVGWMDCRTQRHVAGDWIDHYPGVWRPWCVLGRGAFPRDGALWQQSLAQSAWGTGSSWILPTTLVDSAVGAGEQVLPGTRPELAATNFRWTQLYVTTGQMGGRRWPGLPRFLARR